MSDANVAPPLATNVMLSEWDTFCALSVEMEPLRSANDVGVLLQAMRQYPAGLPDRVSLIAAELPAYSTQQIALLLARLDTVGIGLVQTSSRLADTGPQVHLLPPPTTCVVCGEPGLMVDRKPSGAVRPPSSPTVVSERGILQGILHSKTCGKCGALHGMSYADGGSGLPSGKQMPYEQMPYKLGKRNIEEPINLVLILGGVSHTQAEDYRLNRLYKQLAITKRADVEVVVVDPDTWDGGDDTGVSHWQVTNGASCHFINNLQFHKPGICPFFNAPGLALT